MARFKAPKFGTLSFRGAGGRHRAEPGPLAMPQDDEPGGGAHRREGRHGIDRSREQYRPTPTGAPAGQHRPGGRPAPAGRHRQPELDSTWYPTKTDWRRLMAGETVNGMRLAGRQHAGR